ncbi:MAG: hypothetical protein Q9Q13_07125 [Acidobacteriota bacterium]|nr:hypothetical protein [Acidobacteriota bacterium]
MPASALFEKLAGGDIQARWDDSCNLAELPGQTYSVESGDLDLLASDGLLDTAPVAGRCDRLSPDAFTPAPGNRFFLLAANEGGRQGGLGRDGAGLSRPHAAGACGRPREAACP